MWFIKIIISHDVDHLSAFEHVFKDLILPKLWVRSFLHLCTGKIGFRTFWYRLSILLHPRLHRIEEVMQFDRDHGIPSTFFFGMENVLGMSYAREKALPMLQKVLDNGFDAGVHGVDYQSLDNIQAEYSAFSQLSGLKQFGLRNHYVRFNDETFAKMHQAGYLFDTTWFNKKTLDIRAPYKVGDMWEFPLHIMDGYICKPGALEKGLSDTFEAIRAAEAQGMPYCTILFHDYQFCNKYDPQMKEWYTQTIDYLQAHGYHFVSYRDAIQELEEQYADNAICQ